MNLIRLAAAIIFITSRLNISISEKRLVEVVNLFCKSR